MRKLFRALLLSTAFIPVSLTASADTLPLQRVVISSSGLALYEHKGTVHDNQDIELPVRLDRVDDMLKSLVILDAKGQLGGISLPGREPLSQTFRDLPFQQQDLDDLVQLLTTLRGADVQLDSIHGRLMNVNEETEQTGNNGDSVIVRHRVSILTDAGIKTALLETAGSLQFTDKTVQAQLDRALGALFSNRIKDQRSLTISLHGQGDRTVGLAYIQDAPLWKSSYRLVLPEDNGKKTDAKDEKAVLQGWAVLENTTGQDWNHVNVTLMSGAPVTYHQALYESYYVPRPELPVKVMDRVLPRPDEGAVSKAEIQEAASSYEEEGGGVMQKATPASARMRRAEAAPMAPEMMAMDAYAAGAIPPQPVMSSPGMAAVATANAAETASQMVFNFPQPVDLPAGNTLMLPFVSSDLPAEKLWVYQPETDAEHPLTAVAVKNTSGSGLPPGILTIYDNGPSGFLHVGDADMPLLPKDEERFITFALDTKTKIDRQEQEDRSLGVITISKGMLRQKVSWRNTTTYTIRAPEDEARTIVIEHPRREGWDLSKPEGLAGEPDMSPTHYRLRLDVPAGQSKKLAVTLQHDDVEAVGLNAVNPADLETRMAAVGKDMPAPVKKALLKIKEMQSAVFELRQQIATGEQERQRIYADQERLRQNLQTVSASTAIGKRYLATMEQQENKLEEIAAKQDATRGKLEAAQKELRDYVAGLDL